MTLWACCAPLFALLMCACEDSRPPSAPHAESGRSAVVQRWNSLEARLEADNESRVRARLTPEKNVELDAAVARASDRLHEAHRVLETLRLGLPEQARDEAIERAHATLDEAESSIERADALREATEETDAGAAAIDAAKAPDGA